MKKILFILIAVVTACSAKAQFIDSVKALQPDIKIHYINTPEFPGGPDNMNQWISNNIKYSNEVKKAGAKGVIKVAFVVYEDGSLHDFNVVQGLFKEADEEAIRVISIMPKWKPGTIDGNLTKYKYILPVKFRIK